MAGAVALASALGSTFLPLSASAGQAVAQGEVIASIKPLGLIAAAIGDGVSEPAILIEDGASPHHYALKPSSMRGLMEAKLVFWIGPELERSLDKPLARTSAHKLALISEGVHDEHEHNEHDEHDEHAQEADHEGHDAEHEHDVTEEDHDQAEEGDAHDHGGLDVHPWLDPIKALGMARAMHREMVELYPAGQAQLDRNLARFEASIIETDRRIGEMLSPLQDRGFYVFHDAYTGFVEHYGLNQLGYFTLEPSQKPGARHLAEIRAQLEAQQAVCVMSEPQFSSALVESVTSGLELKQGEVDPLAIGVTLGPDAYTQYMLDLARRFQSCLSP
ncbi:zinc ABC transporter substrate-binding protein ZnuA [Marinobacterium sp. D7]|uniref:zinc ABC transporter substrate-binding protein ZnuA n=1 Tax=Marinobacterium ramblicola TaxID=2849041 RepID=UPI001C2D8ABC|nr:zinc ABC transporter substrate-binding protein ZnuA [Marinobacterium ramblicola]MBV1789292.1 zinc ABC transporter substrate-binding protein ZnuA [Marinobacterium ramblicola]